LKVGVAVGFWDVLVGATAVLLLENEVDADGVELIVVDGDCVGIMLVGSEVIMVLSDND
jgi:hypothetical protein